MPRDVGDVLRGLQSALDLERGHAHFDQLRNQVISRQVLGAQQILNVVEINELAVADDLIRHAARLGALTPIRRAATERLAGQTLSGISDAQGAMDEDFNRKIDRFANSVDLSQCQLAGENHARAAQVAGECNSRGARDGHLRRGVDFKVRSDGANEPNETQVLHDDGVDSGGRQFANGSLEIEKLAGEHQRVQCDIAAHTATVK